MRKAHNKKDITGQIFGSLTVIREVEKKMFKSGGRTQYLCQCQCGNTVKVLTCSLTTGNTMSCGCLRSLSTSFLNYKHGMTGSKIYRTWQAMLNRCRNKKVNGYENYGGRGISVCKRWDKFENFLLDMGEPEPGESIERIKNDKNYTPSNCKWATAKEQALNTRSNRKITFNGETLCLCEWARRLKIDQSSLRERLEKWAKSVALTKPKTRGIRKNV